jgi:hypothetical protein
VNFKNLYVNGCSFSCGNGLDLIEIKQLYKDKLSIDIDNHLNFAYPNILAKKYNLSIINEAVPGGSLNRMIRKTYNYIFNNVDILSDTLFVLEIPPMWRDEFYSNKLDRLINVTWGTLKHPHSDLTNIRNGYDVSDILSIHGDLENYFKNFVDIDFEEKKSMKNMLGLLSYLIINNLNYILIDCSGFDDFLKKNGLKDEYNFLWFDNKKMHHWIDDNKLRISDELNIEIDRHAGIEGNKIIAERLEEYINKKF